MKFIILKECIRTVHILWKKKSIIYCMAVSKHC